MKNKIEDLRNHLFATLEALQDQDKPMELDRAKAVAEVAQTIINSAKVEVDFLKAVGGTKPASGFMTLEPAGPRLVSSSGGGSGASASTPAAGGSGGSGK